MIKTATSRSLIVRFVAGRSGTSAVEFALMSPLFFMLFFGMVAYGLYFGASHSVQQIAADAARVSIAGLDAKERESPALDYVSLNAAAYPLIDLARLQAEARTSDADATQFVVSITFDARDLPIWSLFSGLPLPDMTIARRSTIRIGGL